MNHFVNVQSNGRFELSYSTLLTSPCNFDMKGFPFDQQTCTFRVKYISLDKYHNYVYFLISIVRLVHHYMI